MKAARSKEVARLPSQVNGTELLMASRMYGGGLRLLECAELRVKDLAGTGYPTT